MAFNQNARNTNENLKFVETDDGNVGIRVVGASGSTSIDVTNTSTDLSGYVGKESGTNADFTTAYVSGTTINLSSLPTGVSSITADDIDSVIQIATDGSVTKKYTREDVIFTASGTDPTTLTVTGAAFVNTDTFVVYTNIPRKTSIADAESTVPTELSDEDEARLITDTFRKLIIAGYNYSQNSLDSNEVAPALLLTQKQTGITQLTAPGDTAEITVENYGVYGYSFTVAAIDTNVIVELEGSVDGTNYGTLSLDNTAIANAAITNNQITITANGTYRIYSSEPIVDVRFNFVSETGGTAATIDVDFFARRI